LEGVDPAGLVTPLARFENLGLVIRAELSRHQILNSNCQVAKESQHHIFQKSDATPN
jgi:hypothetical protein